MATFKARKPSGTTSGSGDSRTPVDVRTSDSSVIKMGMLKKQKTNKRKHFVLRSRDDVGSARLEYYDSYKKWSSGQAPKKCVYLDDCFKIARRIDTRNKLAVGLYLRDATFSVVCDDEDSLQDWLQHLLEAKYGDDGEPNQDQVWDVNVKCKFKEDNDKVRNGKVIQGQYRFILRSEGIMLAKVASKDTEPEVWTLDVPGIRSCMDGAGPDTFSMELGNRSPLGHCELFFQTEEAAIAKALHQIVADFMRNWRKEADGFGDHRERLRSFTSVGSSSSKATSIRRHTSVTSRHSSTVTPPPSSLASLTPSATLTSLSTASASTTRVRADTMPTSRAPRSRTTSEGGFGKLSLTQHHQQQQQQLQQHHLLLQHHPQQLQLLHHVHGPLSGTCGGAATAPAAPSALSGGLAAFSGAPRPPSFYGSGGSGFCTRSIFSASPPATNSPLSPSSGHCSDSAGSSLSVDAEYTDAVVHGVAHHGAHPHHHLHHHLHLHHHHHHLVHHLGHEGNGSGSSSAGMITTQPPIIEENPDAGSGECVVTPSPAIPSTSNDDAYIPFDPEKRVLKRLIPRSPAPPVVHSLKSPSPPEHHVGGAGPVFAKSPTPPPSLLSTPGSTPAPPISSVSASDYLEMSPSPAGFVKSAKYCSSVASTSGGSVAGDDYLDMGPRVRRESNDDNYLDMVPECKQHPRESTPHFVDEDHHWRMPPGHLMHHHLRDKDDTASVSSMLSGTTSTDFHLLMADDLLDHPEMRPRTQSTGSHIDKTKKKTRTAELQALAVGHRLRAHSMGSQVPKWKRGARRLFDAVGGVSLLPPSSNSSQSHSAAVRFSPGSSTASSSVALHGTSPVSKSWTAPGQYFKLMGATLAGKVTPVAPASSITPVQPTSSQLAKDETLRFFFQKRHSLDHSVSNKSKTSTDTDYGWLEPDEKVVKAVRRKTSMTGPVGVDMTPEMAIASVAATQTPAQGKGLANANLTPSLMLCHDWLAAHHGHEKQQDEYLMTDGYQQAPNSAPIGPTVKKPQWPAPAGQKKPDPGSDYVNLDPNELAKLSPFVLAARERAAQQAKEKLKPPLPSFTASGLPKGPLKSASLDISSSEKTGRRGCSVSESSADEKFSSIPDWMPSLEPDCYVDMQPICPPLDMEAILKDEYLDTSGMIFPARLPTSGSPAVEEEDAVGVVSDQQAQEDEEEEEEEGEEDVPPARNSICSPVVEEDWTALSQESMNHIINDFSLSEKCEVDASSGTLKIVDNRGPGIAGMLKVSSTPLLRSCSSTSSSSSSSNNLVSLTNQQSNGCGSSSSGGNSNSGSKKKSRHCSDPVALSSTSRLNMFPLTRDDLLRPLNKPLKKLRGALRGTTSTPGTPSYSSKPRLNYAQLDLCFDGRNQSAEDPLTFVTSCREVVNYAQIDFNKSEGLRTTSMSLHRLSK